MVLYMKNDDKHNQSVSESDYMTVSEYFNKVRKALDLRYEQGLNN